MTTIVSDTSVLCYLALIGRLNLLELLFTTVLIPEVVFQECLHPSAPSALRNALSPFIPSFITVVSVDSLLPETATLDPGEMAAITLAWEHREDSLLLLDERRGRAIATSLGLRLRGLLGIIAEGHRRRYLDFDQSISHFECMAFA